MKIVLVLVLFAAAGVGVWWFGFRQPPVVEPPRQTDSPKPVTVSSFDEFNQDLAKRVTDVLVPGGAPDFQVVVTPATDPIGTLYRKGRSVPYDDMSCAPPADPASRSMPNAFPSYALDAKIAGEAGLDPALFQGVANVGATLGAASSFSFSVLNAQVKTLTDAVIDRVLAGAGCVGALRGEMVIVRGYVIGQRQFSTKSSRSAGANTAVTKVGRFEVSADNSGVLTITDTAPQQFLQILSVVTPPPASARSGLPRVAALTLPTAVNGVGRIYVQQPRIDDAAKGRQIVGLLSDTGLNVVPQVEGTENDKTPDRAQVRYFNEADKANATKVLDTLKQKYPDAVLVPLKIPAPSGQVEVWLPRVQTPPTAPTPPRSGRPRDAPAAPRNLIVQ